MSVAVKRKELRSIWVEVESLKTIRDSLNKDIAKLQVLKRSLTKELPKEISEGLIKAKSKDAYYIVSSVAGHAANYFDVSLSRLTSPSRERELVLIRNMLFNILRNHYGLGLSRIGSFFSRDHSTVVMALKTFSNELEVDKEYRQDYTAFYEYCTNEIDKDDSI